MIKRIIAALFVTAVIVPASAQIATARPLPAECLWYQTFAERNITDCI